MRPSATIATFLAVACATVTAACTSSSGDPGRTFTAPHTTVPVTSPVSTVGTSRTSTPPPSRPTIPADVPRTGPNTRKGEQPPVMPIAATKHSPDGAKAFAEFFIKTIDWGYATTSSVYMRHYFSDCTSCSGFASSIDKVKIAGHHYVGGRLKIVGVQLHSKPFLRKAAYTVAIQFDLQAYEEATRSGKPVRASPAQGGVTLDVSLKWRSAWSVVDVAAQR